MSQPESLVVRDADVSAPARYTWLLPVSVFTFVLAYLALALHTAASTPLWEDEILSVWAAQAGSPSQINAALAHGAQSSPPAYSVLLHYTAALLGYGNLAMRLPSLLAVLGACSCLFVLLRRRLGVVPALLGAAHALLVLSFFALQARPYAIVTLCYVAALLLWDNLDRVWSARDCVGIGLLLALAVAFHFYAVLFVPIFGLIEIYRSVRRRSFRPSLWLALVAAGASIFAWNSVMGPTRTFVASDVSASTDYGMRPTLDGLILAYVYLFQGASATPLLEYIGLPGCLVLALGGALILVRVGGR
ncbi:MAG TPA: glycosyltransferase family 39 protein, partial [Terracidiphilus sp.]|nr:glycosyltransferase family 39 protein [Terracidiphilus sp.]